MEQHEQEYPQAGVQQAGVCSRDGGVDSETWESTTPPPLEQHLHGLRAAPSAMDDFSRGVRDSFAIEADPRSIVK